MMSPGQTLSRPQTAFRPDSRKEIDRLNQEWTQLNTNETAEHQFQNSASRFTCGGGAVRNGFPAPDPASNRFCQLAINPRTAATFNCS
jgi:hypothetical protein